MIVKIFVCIFFSLITCAGYCQYSPSRFVPLDSATVKNAGLIALVRIDEMNDEYVDCHLKMHFKEGLCVTDFEFLLRVKGDRYNFNYGSDYLVFANKDEDCTYYIDKNSRIIPADKCDKDIAFLKSLLPCTNPKMKESLTHWACHRDLRPVCGCDSVTYDNTCEAVKKGVMIFTLGACKGKK
jgi:hypothetical protein